MMKKPKIEFRQQLSKKEVSEIKRQSRFIPTRTVEYPVYNKHTKKFDKFVILIDDITLEAQVERIETNIDSLARAIYEVTRKLTEESRK